MTLPLFPGQERLTPTATGVEYEYCSEHGQYYCFIARTPELAYAMCEDTMMRQERY